MKKYQVMGTATITVYKEVWAANEEDAIDRASNELQELTPYCGNGGYDKLIGVEGSNESIEAGGWIDWNETEVIDDNPDYFECFHCDTECEKREDIEGDEYWYCENCNQVYDEDGYEVTVEFDDEE